MSSNKGLYNEYWDIKRFVEDNYEEYVRVVYQGNKDSRILMRFDAWAQRAQNSDYVHFQPIKDKRKLGYLISYEATDLSKPIYFSLATFKRYDTPPADPEILIRSNITTLRKRNFYMVFGLVAFVVLLLDIILCRTKIVYGFRKMTRVILWERKWRTGFLKSLLGCDYTPWDLDIRLSKEDMTKAIIDQKVKNKHNKKLVILDAGCGEGQIANLADQLGCECIAMDISEWGIRRAPRQVVRIIGDLLHLPFRATRKFDVIFLYEVIEHFEKGFGRVLIRRLVQILAENGTIVISTPNPHTPRQRIIRKLLGLKPETSINWVYHKKEYAVQELLSLLRREGLKTIEVISSTAPDIPFIFLLRRTPFLKRLFVNLSLTFSLNYYVICTKANLFSAFDTTVCAKRRQIRLAY